MLIFQSKYISDKKAKHVLCTELMASLIAVRCVNTCSDKTVLKINTGS